MSRIFSAALGLALLSSTAAFAHPAHPVAGHPIHVASFPPSVSAAKPGEVIIPPAPPKLIYAPPPPKQNMGR